MKPIVLQFTHFPSSHPMDPPTPLPSPEVCKSPIRGDPYFECMTSYNPDTSDTSGSLGEGWLLGGLQEKGHPLMTIEAM